MRTSFIAAVAGLGIIACSNPLDTANKTQGLEEEVADLRMRLEAVEASGSIDRLDERLSTIETTLAAHEVETGAHAAKFAQLELGAGYGVVEIWQGKFLVSWKDSKPQGDGTLLMFDVGNTTSASWSDVKVKVNAFAAANKSAEKPWDQFPKKLGEIESKSTADLLPGRWSRISVRLPGVKPETISTLTVTIEVGKGALNK
jgi:hypothetical protein